MVRLVYEYVMVSCSFKVGGSLNIFTKAAVSAVICVKETACSWFCIEESVCVGGGIEVWDCRWCGIEVWDCRWCGIEVGDCRWCGIEVWDCRWGGREAVYYTHLRAHETGRKLGSRLLLEKKKDAAYAQSSRNHQLPKLRAIV